VADDTPVLTYRCGGSAGITRSCQKWRTGFPFHPEYGGIQGTWSKIVMLRDFRDGLGVCQEKSKLLIDKQTLRYSRKMGLFELFIKNGEFMYIEPIFLL
jgi:hypothetical protein